MSIISNKRKRQQEQELEQEAIHQAKKASVAAAELIDSIFDVDYEKKNDDRDSNTVVDWNKTAKFLIDVMKRDDNEALQTKQTFPASNTVSTVQKIENDIEFKFEIDHGGVDDEDYDGAFWNDIARLFNDVTEHEDHKAVLQKQDTETKVISGDDEEELKHLDALVLNDASLWLNLPPHLPLSMAGGFDDGSFYYEKAGSYGLAEGENMIPLLDDDDISTALTAPLLTSTASSVVSTSSEKSSSFSFTSSNESSKNSGLIFSKVMNAIGVLSDPVNEVSLSSLKNDNTIATTAEVAVVATEMIGEESSSLDGKEDLVALLCGKEWLQTQQQMEKENEEGEVLPAVTTTTTNNNTNTVKLGKKNVRGTKQKRKPKKGGDSKKKKSNNNKNNKQERRYSYLKPGVVEYLRTWIMSEKHIDHPYPTDYEKRKIMDDTGITRKQLQNWFINNRKRYWKPRVENKKNQK